jgi:hypothetical protein
MTTKAIISNEALGQVFTDESPLEDQGFASPQKRIIF